MAQTPSAKQSHTRQLSQSLSSISLGGVPQKRTSRTTLYILLLIGTPLYLLTRRSSEPHLPSQSFCPVTKAHSQPIPTVILQGTGTEFRHDNRTYWVTDPSGAEFLPIQDPRHELRFLQKPPAVRSTWSAELDASEAQKAVLSEGAKSACSLHRVPSSPRPVVPSSWRENSIMFGMSTLPDRILFNIPVWSHWFPSHERGVEPTLSVTRQLPLILILVPPPNPTESARASEALDEAQTLGINLEIRSLVANRFEERYMGLVEEMWAQSLKREDKEGVKTECDDDTFFPDYDSVKRMLSLYDSSTDVLVGALSECYEQVQTYGHMAFGGAGIFISRPLMAKMNAPGQYDACVKRFGNSFGGDAMVSLCAALATEPSASTELLQSTELPALLQLDNTLHQLDIRGDSTGWFQSGFLITSLHHWASWYTLFPPWHSMGMGDVRKTIKTVGVASKLMGGDNFGRRYVFDEGKVVIALGYSVTLYADSEKVTPDMLAKSEHTWVLLDSYHPTRDSREESLHKRTYYLTAVRDIQPGIVRLEHMNREGERVDVLWDGREGKAVGWEVEKARWTTWRARMGGNKAPVVPEKPAWMGI